MNESVARQLHTTQSATADREALCAAVRAVPIGVLDWCAKMLLEHLVLVAARNGEPPDVVATTRPKLADALGCSELTIGECLRALVDEELVRVVRRLFRGERHRLAPALEQGGTIIRINRAEILRHALENQGPTGNRYRPVSRAALAQSVQRQRELEEELARLRGELHDLLSRLDARSAIQGGTQTAARPPREVATGGVEAAQGAAKGTGGRRGDGLTARSTHRRSAPYERFVGDGPRLGARGACPLNDNGSALAAAGQSRRAA